MPKFMVEVTVELTERLLKEFDAADMEEAEALAYKETWTPESGWEAAETHSQAHISYVASIE